MVAVLEAFFFFRPFSCSSAFHVRTYEVARSRYRIFLPAGSFVWFAFYFSFLLFGWLRDSHRVCRIAA